MENHTNLPRRMIPPAVPMNSLIPPPPPPRPKTVYSSILALDVETTGLPMCRTFNVYPDYKSLRHYATSRVIQIGAALYDGSGNAMKTREWIIKPEMFSIPLESSKIHGITNKVAQNLGLPLHDVIVDLMQMVDTANIIICHNSKFDRNVLAAEMYRYGHTGVAAAFWRKPFKCTMEMGRSVACIPTGTPGVFKSPSLSELHEFLFSETFEGHHTALADAVACARCYFKIMDEKLAPEKSTLDKIIECSEKAKTKSTQGDNRITP